MTGELSANRRAQPGHCPRGVGPPRAGHGPPPRSRTSPTARPPCVKGVPHTDSFRALNEALSGFENPPGILGYRVLHPGRTAAPRGCPQLCRYGCLHWNGGGRRPRWGYSPAVAAIGDSTFSHGGITPLLSAVQQHVNLNVLVVDNSTVGHDRDPAFHVDRPDSRPDHPRDRNRRRALPHHRTDALAITLANIEVMREELAYDGPSVIVARRACIEALKVAPGVRVESWKRTSSSQASAARGSCPLLSSSTTRPSIPVSISNRPRSTVWRNGAEPSNRTSATATPKSIRISSPSGRADLILSVEPLEVLRYWNHLRPDGWVVTSVTPYVRNIPDYPEMDTLLEELAPPRGRVRRRPRHSPAFRLICCQGSARDRSVPWYRQRDEHPPAHKVPRRYSGRQH